MFGEGRRVPDRCAGCVGILCKGAVRLLGGHVLHLPQNHALAHQALEGLLVADQPQIIQHLPPHMHLPVRPVAIAASLTSANMQLLLNTGLGKMAAMVGCLRLIS